MKSTNALAAARRRLKHLEITLTCSTYAGLGAEHAATARENIALDDLAGAEAACDRITAMVRDFKARRRAELSAAQQGPANSFGRLRLLLATDIAQSFSRKTDFLACQRDAMRRATAAALEGVAAAGERAMADFAAGYGNSAETKDMRQTIIEAIRSLISAPPRAKPGPSTGGAAAMRAELDRMNAEGWRPRTSAMLKETHAEVIRRLNPSPAARGYGLDTFRRNCLKLRQK